MRAATRKEARASVMQALYADWGMAAARAAARMRLERVRFVGLSRAQVHAASRSGGGRQRPEREERRWGTTSWCGVRTCALPAVVLSLGSMCERPCCAAPLGLPRYSLHVLIDLRSALV